MRKLYTILFTIIILLITITPSFATCEQSDNFWNTLQNGNYRFSYIHNDGTETFAGASDGTSISVNNIKAYKDITAYFDLDHIWKHINLTGVITLTSTVPNQLTTEYVVSNLSAPTLLYQLDNGGFVEWGSCQFTSINLSNITEFVVNSATGTDRYSQQNINYSVQCYAGENAPANKIKALRFYLFKNQYNSTTSMNANISLVHHLNSDYQTYQGEYNNELCRIQELLNGIGNSTSSGVSSGDITQQTQDIINNNNTNTQQIVNQLNGESCSQVSCSNLFHPVGSVTAPSSGAMGDSYVEFNNTWGTQDLNIRNSQTIFTLERNKTYYYNFVCDHDNLYNIKFGSSSGNYTSNMSCGTGNFTWNLLDTNVDIVVVSVTYPGGNTNIRYRIDIYVSETEGEFCNYGTSTEVCSGSNRLDNINNSIGDLQNTITNQDNTQANNDLDDILEINVDDFGFTSFGNISISYLNQIQNKVCSSWQLQVPYVTTNRYITIPCFSQYYNQHFGTLFAIIQMIYRALISYWCILQIYNTIHKILDVDSDEIYIFEL